jgi:hypothetical protein
METQKSLNRLEQAECGNPTQHSFMFYDSSQCFLLSDDKNQLTLINSSSQCQPQTNNEHEKQKVGKDIVPHSRQESVPMQGLLPSPTVHFTY